MSACALAAALAVTCAAALGAPVAQAADPPLKVRVTIINSQRNDDVLGLFSMPRGWGGDFTTPPPTFIDGGWYYNFCLFQSNCSNGWHHHGDIGASFEAAGGTQGYGLKNSVWYGAGDNRYPLIKFGFNVPQNPTAANPAKGSCWVIVNPLSECTVTVADAATTYPKITFRYVENRFF